ncbi:Uncharacterised protein [Achromobacter sp. 2789STDY5608633]|nr:Uncharacterised protein [Achromobacter sp. 2789STDY5608633]
MHGIAAGVDHQRVGRQQRFHLVQAQRADFARVVQLRRRRLQRQRRLAHFGLQGGNGRRLRGVRGPRQGGAGGGGLYPAKRDAGQGQLVHRPQGRREGRGVQSRQHLLGLFQASHQDQAAPGQVAGIGRIAPVAMLFERGAGGLERRRRPAQVARGQRDLGLGHHAAGARHRIPGAERAGGAAHQRPGAFKVAQLRQRDAAQRQGRRIVAQGHPAQRGQRVAGSQRAGRGLDQSVHEDAVITAAPVRGYRQSTTGAAAGDFVRDWG